MGKLKRIESYPQTQAILFTLFLDSMLFFIVMDLFLLLVVVLANIQHDWSCPKEVVL